MKPARSERPGSASIVFRHPRLMTWLRGLAALALGPLAVIGIKAAEGTLAVLCLLAACALPLAAVVFFARGMRGPLAYTLDRSGVTDHEGSVGPVKWNAVERVHTVGHGLCLHLHEAANLRGGARRCGHVLSFRDVRPGLPEAVAFVRELAETGGEGAPPAPDDELASVR